MIKRENYLNKLIEYKDVNVIKILTGIRRSGKSTLLEMYKDYLVSSGISASHIIQRKYNSQVINITSKNMFEELISQFQDNQKYYLLLDEVQEIDNWEKTINSLFEEYNVDIYVTGSNSKLMSSEISTYLTGRFVNIPVYTLSFKEFLDFKGYDNNFDKNKAFYEYLQFGGFPLIAISNLSENAKYQIVEDIFNTIVFNDITKKHKILNVELFERVIRFIMENVGKTFSANSIVNFLKSEARSISVETIYNILSYLEKAFVIYRCSRYDLQGKAVLKTQEKFYIADSSLKYAMFGYNVTSVASMLENIIYFELKRKGYNVYVGKYFNKEIDFVASKRDERIYIQVCRNMPESSEREINNLLEIKDNYPKYILTLDSFAGGNLNGIKIINIIDYLLS